MQEGGLVDWDDLDYQLAAASEELMKAHARAEQLTEEKLLLERRWAHMQASVQADGQQPTAVMFPQAPASADAQAGGQPHFGSDGAMQWQAAAMKQPPLPPSLADTTPDVLKHMGSGSEHFGSGSGLYSIRPDPTVSKGSIGTERVATLLGSSYARKGVPSAKPSSEPQPSQPERYASHPRAPLSCIQLLRYCCVCAARLMSGGKKKKPRQLI
eukprot:jgi/Ulvmu1/5221/UM022_0014.1